VRPSDLLPPPSAPAPGEPPGFVARIGDGHATGLRGVPAWPGLPDVRLYGPWRPEEVVKVELSAGRLLVLGHCLESPELIGRDFADALDRADLDRLTRWTGAYSCVVVLPGELVAYADLGGQFPIFCSSRGGETLLSSHPGVLADRHRRPPDLLTAVARIACPDALPLWSRRSPYREVQRVGGGMTVRALPGRGRVRVYESAVRPAGDVAPIGPALVTAVGLRCRPSARLGADLSGGLDSTSLAFLAVRSEPARPLHAVTYFHPRAPAADLADATRHAGLDERIRLAVVHGSEDTLPYQDLPGGEFGYSEPAPTLVSWRRAALRFDHVAGAGLATHLTGEGGDAVLGAAPAYLSELVLRRSLRRLIRHCVAHGRLRQQSPAVLLRRAVATAATRPEAALRALGDRVARPRSRASAASSGPRVPGWADAVSWWPPVEEAVSWLTPSARGLLADVAVDPETARAIPAGFSAFDIATLVELRTSADTQCFMRELGGRYGVAVHAPFLDNAVIRSCLAASVIDRADPLVSKPLLAAALGDLVPAQVLARRTKGDYIAEDYRGARRAAAELHGLLAESRLAAAGLVDVASVGRTVSRLHAGVAVPLGALNRLVATEVWLRAVEEGSGRPCGNAGGGGPEGSPEGSPGNRADAGGGTP
jgi:asparagine synthase (glutamine-hydrolysing)